MIEWTDDGYPTEASLQRLRQALQDKDVTRCIEAFYGALKENRWGWCGPERVEVRAEYIDVWAYHTGGWSGNEAILNVLQEAAPWLWAMALERWDKGGHFYFAPMERVLLKDEARFRV